MKNFLLGALGAAAIMLPATAHADGLLIEGNGARAHSEWGGELGVGYNVGAGGFTVRPIVGAFIYQGENDRYRSETTRDGRDICRDLRNGQFADDENCNNTSVKAYAKVEATYTLLGSAEIGGGTRFSSEQARLYGTVSFPLAPRIRVKANAGDRYYAVGLRADF